MEEESDTSPREYIWVLHNSQESQTHNPCPSLITSRKESTFHPSIGDDDAARHGSLGLCSPSAARLRVLLRSPARRRLVRPSSTSTPWLRILLRSAARRRQLARPSSNSAPQYQIPLRSAGRRRRARPCSTTASRFLPSLQQGAPAITQRDLLALILIHISAFLVL
jgi:hypothetical protein